MLEYSLLYTFDLVSLTICSPHHLECLVIGCSPLTLLHTISHIDKYAINLSHQSTSNPVQNQYTILRFFTCIDQLTSMGSLLSTVKQKTSSPTKEPTTASTMGSSTPETFKHYANAQTEFTKTLPLIGNENAFLGDIFSSFASPFSPASPLFIPDSSLPHPSVIIKVK